MRFPIEVMKPPKRYAPEGVADLHARILDLAARIDKAGADLDVSVSSINPDLTDPAKAREEQALRAAFADAVEEMDDRRDTLRDDLVDQASFYTRESIRNRAFFGETKDALQSATLGAFWLARLPKSSPVDLREIAREAASRSDHALCLAVENEVAARGLDGDVADEIIGLCASVPLTLQEKTVADKITEAYGVAEQNRIKVLEWSSGATRAIDRMQAAFDAALLIGRPSLPKVAGSVDTSMSAFGVTDQEER